MKSLAAISAAAFVAAAAVLWFTTKPAVVTVKLQPLKPSADLPIFKRVER